MGPFFICGIAMTLPAVLRKITAGLLIYLALASSSPPTHGANEISKNSSNKTNTKSQKYTIARNDNALSSYEEGIKLYSSGDIQGAIASFSRALRSNKISTRLKNSSLLARAKMYLAISQPLLAWKDLKDIQYKDNDAIKVGELNLMKGVTSIQLKLYKQALLYFNKAETNLPSSAILYSNRGVAYQEVGNLQKARSDFKTAMSIQPDIPTAYNLAVLERKSKNYASCIGILSSIIKKNGQNPAFYQQRGICFARMDLKDEAIKDLLKSLTIDKSNPVALEELGDVVYKMNKRESALKYLESAATVYLQANKSEEYIRIQEKINLMQQ